MTRALSRCAAGFLALAGVTVLAGCGPAIATSATTGRTVLTVFAAASLADALGAAAEPYRSATTTSYVLSTESSTTLRTQIEQGATADVFLAADTANPDALAAAGLVDGAVVPFAGARLAIVVPSANPAGIASPFDLAQPGLKVVAAGAEVPISRYASALLENLAALPGARTDFLAGYATNVVSREDNVRAALAKVELGEADAAIVYASDATASSAVRTIAIPAEANVVATYAAAVPTTAAAPTAGHAFIEWLAGPDGQAILARFGFEPAP